MDKYIFLNSTTELHEELTNILLLCTEQYGDDWYCYCRKEFAKCDLCNLIDFLIDIDDKNLMDGLSPKKFLQFNFNNRFKLEEFSLKILPFFDAIKKNHPNSLEFFERRYHWSSRDYFSGKFLSLSLKEVIENEINFVKYNPQYYNVEQ